MKNISAENLLFERKPVHRLREEAINLSGGFYFTFICPIPDFHFVMLGYSSLGCLFPLNYNHFMKLSDAPLGVQVKIFSFEDHSSLRAKLNQYGIYQGDSLRVMRVAPLGGPFLVEVNGREIALGREIAEKILVVNE